MISFHQYSVHLSITHLQNKCDIDEKYRLLVPETNPLINVVQRICVAVTIFATCNFIQGS